MEDERIKTKNNKVICLWTKSSTFWIVFCKVNVLWWKPLGSEWKQASPYQAITTVFKKIVYRVRHVGEPYIGIWRFITEFSMFTFSIKELTDVSFSSGSTAGFRIAASNARCAKSWRCTWWRPILTRSTSAPPVAGTTQVRLKGNVQKISEARVLWSKNLQRESRRQIRQNKNKKVRHVDRTCKAKVYGPGFRIRIRINLSCWIRIRIQEGKNDPQK